MYPSTFEECLDSRNAENFVKTVKLQTAKLPWKNDALPKIKNLKVSNEIKAGFAKVKQYEEEKDDVERRKIQLKYLLDIAAHEQGVILQPLIYDDPDFAYWIEVQRGALVNWASPVLELVFSHLCNTKVENLKSIAPKETHLEEFKSRMKWINSAATEFHNLMQQKNNYMEQKMRTMAGWVDMPETDIAFSSAL